MPISRRQAALTFAAAFAGIADDKATRDDAVRLVRVPQNGLQPQAAFDEAGTLHLLYFASDPSAGDIFYVKSADRGKSFSPPVRVNSQPGSALAIGSIRGAQLAVGPRGRVHVAWNGSASAQPPGPVNADNGKPGAPLLYSRLNDAGSGFEPQRNLMQNSFGLDGGGSIAADRAGNVYAAWHGIGESEAKGTGKSGEARRRVWLARSENEGRSFSPEAKAWAADTGACGCCGMKIFADAGGTVSALYRSATESVHRDIYLIRSSDRARNFQGRLLDRWNINACPMSSMDIAAVGNRTVCAWETGGQVYWLPLAADGSSLGKPIAPPGDAKGRKHPRVALDAAGGVLLAWTEGTGWQKGGSLAWQRFDPQGRPSSEQHHQSGVPVWSFGAVVSSAAASVVLY